MPANVLESFVLQQTDSLMQTTPPSSPYSLMQMLPSISRSASAKSAQKLELMTLNRQ